MKSFLLCLLCAFLLILSFPNFNLWVCAWFGFVPLFIALEGKTKLKAFLLAYFTGVIFWAGTIYWLSHVTLPGTIILVLYLALYFGFFGLLSRNRGLLFIPSLWVLLEFLRSYLFTGFPWALLGYSQYLNLPAIQIADITGAWGVSFLVMLVNTAIYLVTSRKPLPAGRGVTSKKILISLLILLTVISYGYYKLLPAPRHQSSIKISVIQGNIPQDLKWDAQAKDFIFSEYFSLSSLAARENPDLIIWPEAASPAILEEDEIYFAKIKTFARRLNRPLLLGAVSSKDSFYYNSAFLFSSEGSVLGRYDKLHLVPFGEYIPLKNIFGFLETVVPIGEVAPGKEYTVFNSQATSHKLQVRFAVLICFEDLFPELSRRFRMRGADFLVNITNDAWYKKTAAPYQHLQASVFRAVENRVPLARAANTGISGFILAQGRVISLPAFAKGYKTADIALSGKDITFYSRYGDIFIFACLIFVFSGIAPAFLKR